MSLRFDKEKNLAESIDFPPQGPRSISIAKPSKFNFGFFLILVIAIAAGAAAGFFYFQLQQEKQQRLALEAAQIQIEDKAASYEQSLKQKEKESASLREKLKSAESEMAGLQTQLQKQRDESQIEISQLQTQVEDLRQKLTQSAADSVQTEFDLQPVGPKAADQDTRTQKEDAVAPTAQVLSINEKFNFVVINWGSKDDLKLGDGIQFLREGKGVGEATVEKLYDNFAAATVTKQPSEDPIREGDLAVKA